MSMKSVKLTELNEAVRSFLSEAGNGEGIRVEDETGQVRYSVLPFYRATKERQEEALRRLAKIQRRTRERMERDGKTEEELDRILQEDE